MSIWSNWGSPLVASLGRRGRRRAKGRRRNSKTPRFGIEALESRRLLTVSASVLANSLFVDIDAADNVTITSSGGNVKINGIDPTGGLFSSNLINGVVLTATGNFANTIDLTGIAAGSFGALGFVSLDAGDGNDIYKLDQSGLLGAAAVSVSDTGAADSNSLILSTSSAVGEMIGVSSLAVTRSTGATVSYSGIESLTVSGTAASDTFHVSNTGATTLTTIQGLNGAADTYDAIDLTTIGAAGLVLQAGNAAGESLVAQAGAPVEGTINLTSTTVVQGAHGTLTYSGLEQLTAKGTAAADHFHVTNTNGMTATTIQGLAGAVDTFDQIDLTTIGTAGLTVTAGGNGESLTVNTTTAGTVAVSSALVQRSGNGPVNYSGLATLIVNGTAGVDTFNIASTAAGTATTINASTGIDVFGAIDLTTIGAAGLTINAGGDGESLTLNTTTAGTVGVSSTQVQRSGNGAITYGGLATLVVNGTPGVETFNVASTAAATITTINAGTGTDLFAAIDLTTIGAAGLTINAGGDGESLTLNTTTAGTVGVSSTQVQRSGNGAITYGGLATLIVNGTAGVDTFNVSSTAANTATTINAGTGIDIFAAIDLTTIGAAGLTINAGGDGEALTLNTTTAGTVALSSTQVQRNGNGAITYGGFATLTLNGSAGVDTFNVASTAANTATTINAGTGTDAFGAIALTTIGAAGLTINAGGDGESLTLNTTTAGSVGITSTQVQRSGNGAITYGGLATLIVNGTAGIDTFNVSSTAASTATTINAGTGTDIFGAIDLTTIGAAGLTINAGGDGESLTLNTTTAGTVGISSTQVQRSGNGAITYGGLATLIVNGTAGVDTFNIASTAANTATTINAATGIDVFAAIDLTTIGAAGLTINAGGDGESLTLNTTTAGTVALSSTQVQRSGNGAITYSGLSALLLNGTAGIDTFNVASTAAGTATTINAGTGTDVFGAISLTTIGAAGLTINAGGDGESLTLNTTTAGTVGVSSTQVQRNGNGAIAYGGLATLIVNGTAGVDTFNVSSTAANITTTINAGTGTDVFGAIDLTTIGAAGLTINAGGDGESLTLNTTTAGTVALSSTQVQRSGNGAITYGGLATLIVNGTAGVDTFNVSSTAASTATTINAGTGTDIFAAIDLTTIGAAGLTINAGGDGESLTVNTTSAGTVALSSTQVQRSGNGAINYGGLSTLIVNGTAGVDTFNIASTTAGTATTVNGLDQDDVFNINNLSLVGAAGLTVDGGNGNDSLTAQAASAAGTVVLNGTQIKQGAAGTVGYSSFATLIVNGTSSVDTFQIDSTAAGTATTINGLDQNDVFNVTNLSLIGAAGLTLNGAPGNDSLTAQVASGAGIVVLNSSQITQGAAGTVSYSGFATMVINGTSAVDTFQIDSTATGTATTVNSLDQDDVFNLTNLSLIGTAGLTLDGGNGNDSLTAQVAAGAGTTVLNSTQIKQGAAGAVGYSSFAILVVNGTSAVDTFQVDSTATGTATTINGLDQDDVFNLTNLSLISATSASLSLDGGNSDDSLTAQAASGAGTVVLNSTQIKQGAAGAVGYDNFATLVINGTSAVDTFQVDSTATGTATTINGLDQDDVFNLTNLSLIATAGLTLNGAPGNDSLTAQAASGAGTVVLNSTQLKQGAAGVVTYSGFATMTINGTSAVDTFQVDSTATGTATTINGLDQDDVFNLTDLSLIATAGLNVNGAPGNDSLTAQVASGSGTVVLNSTQLKQGAAGIVTYSGFATLTINGTSGVDTFQVDSTAAGTTTTINGLDQDDVFNLTNLSAIAAAGLNVNGAPGNDSLIAQVASGAGTVVLNSTQLKQGAAGIVTYSGFATMTINGTSSVDTFQIDSTAAGTTTTINGLDQDDVFNVTNLSLIATAGLNLNGAPGSDMFTAQVASGAGNVVISSTQIKQGSAGAITYSGMAAFIVNGTSGVDTFQIDSTADGTTTTVNALGGTDVFANIALTTIGAAGLTLNAGGNGEVLTLNTTAAGTVNLTNSQVQRSGNGPITYTGLSSLTLNGTGGIDTLNVISTLAGVGYTIGAGASNDVITLGNAGVLDGIQGAISIHGETNDSTPTTTLTCGPASNTLSTGDTLHFDDSATGANSTYNLGASTFTRTGTALVSFDGLETVVLDAGSGGDTINVSGTVASVNVTVNGNAGADTINFATNGASSNVTLSGGTGDDAINVQAVAAGSIVLAKGNNDNDTITVSSNAPATIGGTLNAIVGALCVDAGTANTATGTDRILLSDEAQSAVANSNVLVKASTADNHSGEIDNFAGPTNAVNIQYHYDTALEMTLVGSNTLNDTFRVQLMSYAATPSLVLKFDGNLPTAATGMDTVRIDGTGAADTMKIGTFAAVDSATKKYGFRLQNIECLQVFGGTGNDFVQNDTNVSSLIDGGDGDDVLIGGSAADVIFGGDGKDTIYGRNGDDFLFADHEFNNRKPQVKHQMNGDTVIGDAGFTAGDPFGGSPGNDTIVVFGNDVVNAGGQSGDSIIIGGNGSVKLTVEDWLRARFLKPTSANIQAAIDKALKLPCTMI